jgi:hypothetical protein
MNAQSTTQSAVSNLVAPGTEVDAAGRGEALDLGPLAGRRLLLVLRITQIIEQESVDVSVWGSPAGKDWGAQPLFAFPQRFYCSTTPAILDLRQKMEIRFLQARWDVNRWGRGYPRPYFKFALEIQEFDS